MKEGRCFNCKEKRHTILNYPEKAKVFVISGTSNIHDSKDINQRNK